jgi:putative transposase
LFRATPTFFTVAVEDRRADTLTAHIDLLRAAFRTAQAEHPFQIDAVVVLPEHLHVLLTLPEDDARLALRWQRIKTLFTQGVRRSEASIERRDVTGRAPWQRRFWEHTIRDDADYARHVEYIHFNPVRHRYVTRACD